MKSRASGVRIGVAIAVGVVAMGSSPAFAEQEFWDALAAGTGTCADCRLCHHGAVGSGIDTLDWNKPFLVSMSGDAKLGGLPDPTRDSDMDGALDLAELEGQGDPNDPTVGPGQFECPTGPTPEYGCARVSAQAPTGSAWQFLALLGGLLFVRRRR